MELPSDDLDAEEEAEADFEAEGEGVAVALPAVYPDFTPMISTPNPSIPPTNKRPMESSGLLMMEDFSVSVASSQAM